MKPERFAASRLLHPAIPGAAMPVYYLLPEFIPATYGPKERSRKKTTAAVIMSCPIRDSNISYLLD
jgi:hypothetical protein